MWGVRPCGCLCAKCVFTYLCLCYRVAWFGVSAVCLLRRAMCRWPLIPILAARSVSARGVVPRPTVLRSSARRNPRQHSTATSPLMATVQQHRHPYAHARAAAATRVPVASLQEHRRRLVRFVTPPPTHTHTRARAHTHAPTPSANQLILDQCRRVLVCRVGGYDACIDLIRRRCHRRRHHHHPRRCLQGNVPPARKRRRVASTSAANIDPDSKDRSMHSPAHPPPHPLPLNQVNEPGTMWLVHNVCVVRVYVVCVRTHVHYTHACMGFDVWRGKFIGKYNKYANRKA